MKKMCLLAFKRFLSLYKKEKRLFTLCIFGIMIAMFGMLYYGGSLWNSYYCNTYVDEMVLRVYISDDADKKDIVKNLSEIVDNKINKLFVKKIMDSCGPDEQALGEYVGEKIFSSTAGEKNIYCGRYFEENESKPVAIVTEDMEFKLEIQQAIGYTVEIGDEKFEVVGMRYGSEYPYAYCIPYDYYINHFDVDYIRFDLSEYPSGKVKQQLQSYLDNTSGVNKYSLPEKPNPFNDSNFINNLKNIILIFAVSLIDFFVIVYYLTKKNKRHYDICRLYGASKIKIIFYVIISILLIVILSDAIALLLFGALYKVIYIKELSKYVTIVSFLTIMGIHFCICLLYSIIVAIAMTINGGIYKISNE